MIRLERQYHFDSNDANPPLQDIVYRLFAEFYASNTQNIGCYERAMEQKFESDTKVRVEYINSESTRVSLKLTVFGKSYYYCYYYCCYYCYIYMNLLLLLLPSISSLLLSGYISQKKEMIKILDMYNESLCKIYKRLPRYVTTCPQCLAKGTATSTFTYGFIQKISEQSKQSSFIGTFYHILDDDNN